MTEKHWLDYLRLSQLDKFDVQMSFRQNVILTNVVLTSVIRTNAIPTIAILTNVIMTNVILTKCHSDKMPF
jgi:hypothetical protein